MKANFNQALWEKILAIDLTRVLARLIHKLHFTPDRAEEAIKGYRQYLYLINTVGKMTPSADVDEAWHAHILHLPAYVRDCMASFGKVIWHVPKPIIDGKAICSGECNAGGDDYNFKPGSMGTDCEAFHKKTNMTSFVIDVPIDEYANEEVVELPLYEKFVEEHFA
jgi:hypothetical protein